MAIYHFSAQIISRISSQGTLRSTVAAAAYRSGEKLYAENDMEYKYYQRDVAPETYLLCPDGAPEWAQNRESLWNKVEATEKQYNAQLAREINIALPKELSEQEQTKLVLEFCQKNFVDEGMVADIAIHRDKVNNPHFHVMLTLRQIEGEEFAPKCRKEYVLDKNGNKILLPSGEYKSRRVNLTNWNKQEALLGWRKSWQDITNAYLEKNGIAERIDCSSYKARDIILCPTIHEGPKVSNAINKQSTEIGSYNVAARSYNRTIIDLESYKQERAKAVEEKIARCFTADERRVLVSAAKELKCYVKNDTLENRLKQLAKWEKSVFYNGSEFKFFEKIVNERNTIESAREVLQNEAERFCNKYYPGTVLSAEEKLELAERTMDKGTLLSVSEIDVLRKELLDKEFKELTQNLLSNGNVFMLDAVRQINREEAKARESAGIHVPAGDVKKLDNARVPYHIYQDNQTLQCFIGYQDNRFEITRVTEYMGLKESHAILKDYVRGNIELPVLQASYNMDKVERLEKALVVMDRLYDEQIAIKYGNRIDTSNLLLPEKEMLLHYEEYYGSRYTANIIPKAVYTTREKEEIIDYLLSGQNQMLQSRYPDFKTNNMYINMFVLDCTSDNSLSQSKKADIQKWAVATYEYPHGEENRPHGEEKAASPHSIVSKLLSGARSAERASQQADNSSLMNRIKNRRNRKEREQEQHII